MTFLVPIITFFFLAIFAFFHWRTYSRLPKYSGKSDQHNERIYKDFEFFVKVFIALVGAMGYVRFNYFHKDCELARQAMKGIGGISLLTMITLSIFIICHQGSKIRRWEKIEWKNIIFWQEIWMIIAMFIFASTLWVVANKW